MNRRLITVLLSAVLVISCHEASFVSLRQNMDLSGVWRFSMDSANAGLNGKWYSHILADSVVLPGTLDENRKGIPNNNRSETMRLSRELMYEGKAWYQKDIVVPESWNGKSIRLVMERTKPSRVWVDTIFAGESNDILTAQKYELTGLLKPGKHTITILTDNGKGSVPDGITGSHAWTEHTQTNWNGIIGSFYLEATHPDHIRNVQVFPDIEKKSIRVKVTIAHASNQVLSARIVLRAYSWNTGNKKVVAKKAFPVNLLPGDNIAGFDYEMGEPLLWSEFDPALYKLVVTLEEKDAIDNIATGFGMRKFSTRGTQFTINGHTTFLRGKHDACVFPLTAHPPMDVDSWRRVFKIAKSYHINFYRFHSWTPPQAAFEAADIEGMYLQPELPFWGGFSKDKNSGLNAFLLKEGDNIRNAYGNHASFVMFALGNELSGDQEVMKEMVQHFRKMDNRQLLAYGSNNYLGTKGQAEGEDYYAACRVGADTDSSYKTHIRGSFSFYDAPEGGYINGRYPSTDVNYAGAISHCSVPALGTEVGQYQIYPNYDEIKKYTGVLKPWNLEVFRSRLEANGLSGQAPDFFKASGALSVICYKADIEMALRTPGFGGFHLLDLQDFPGQGTALVGILDAFMDSKGLIAPEGFSEFCNSVVPLLITKKYCWSNNEKLSGKIQVANYSGRSFKNQSILWQLTASDGNIIARNTVKTDIAEGGLSDVANLGIDLSKITKPEKVILSVEFEGQPYKNHYSLWVYPSGINISKSAGIIISANPDDATVEKLREGASVLLVPNHESVKDLTVGGLFTPDYWNYRMFKGISESGNRPVSPGTMSILTNPKHPLFTNFPTDFHSDWQWWYIVKNSRPFILDNTDKDYKPLVQVVDNIERNHKLGLVFEFSVEKGKLLVCMANLEAICDKPEGRQFYSSILSYMQSGSFNPQQKLTPGELEVLFRSKVTSKTITGVKNISYD